MKYYIYHYTAHETIRDGKKKYTRRKYNIFIYKNKTRIGNIVEMYSAYSKKEYSQIVSTLLQKGEYRLAFGL